MKISKRTREEAALICAMVASSKEPMAPCVYILDVVDYVNASARAENLARAAVVAVEKKLSRGWTVLNYAEAEAMLRTGWSPG